MKTIPHAWVFLWANYKPGQSDKDILTDAMIAQCEPLQQSLQTAKESTEMDVEKTDTLTAEEQVNPSEIKMADVKRELEDPLHPKLISTTQEHAIIARKMMHETLPPKVVEAVKTFDTKRAAVIRNDINTLTKNHSIRQAAPSSARHIEEAMVTDAVLQIRTQAQIPEKAQLANLKKMKHLSSEELVKEGDLQIQEIGEMMRCFNEICPLETFVKHLQTPESTTGYAHEGMSLTQALFTII